MRNQTKWFAIPLRTDGTECIGTTGVLTGNYASKQSMLRYCVNKYGVSGTTYVLYIKGNSWMHKGLHTVGECDYV